MPVATKGKVEIHIRSRAGSQVYFRPIGRPVRGYIDTAEFRTDIGQALKKVWAEPVAGQVLGVNFGTGEKYLREPLHDPKHRFVKEKIEGKGLRIPEPMESFKSENMATWLYWMKRAVESGDAELIEGEFPSLDSLNEPIRKTFVTNTPPPSSEATMVAEAFQAFTKVLERNNELLAKLVK